jgi:AAA family ATP:ADP antiporter
VVDTAVAMYGSGAESESARQQFIGTTYSSYFSYVNLIGFLLQLFVVSRVIKLLGVGRSLLIHPVVALAGYLLMLRAPSFEMVRWLKIADNSLDYSLGNITKQALWLPTSRAAKYKAKQAVDSFCVRAGDVLQAGVVYMGELTALGVSGFAALNVVFACGWLAAVVGLKRRLRARMNAEGGGEF